MTIRRITALVAASLLLLVVAGVPAWAGASFTEPEVEADAEQGLTLRVTEPGEENEAYGDTARVVMRAPSGFTMLSCGSTPVGWSCAVAEDGTRLTLTRTSPLALASTRDFGFTVHTSPFNGSYAFRVIQADGPPAEEGEEAPATVPSEPVVTVTSGKDRPPEPDPSPTANDSGGTDGGGSQGSSGTADGGGTNGGAPDVDDEEAPASSEDDQDAGAEDTGTSDSGSTGGSTAPRRTQGRASGTTLEITPGEPVADDPAIAPPAVADDPAVAPPSRGDDRNTSDSAAAAGTGAQPSDQPDRGAAWQQWVGGAMLLAGLATVGIRWLRQRRAS